MAGESLSSSHPSTFPQRRVVGRSHFHLSMVSNSFVIGLGDEDEDEDEDEENQDVH